MRRITVKNNTIPDEIETHEHTHALITCCSRERSVLGACKLFASWQQCSKFEVSENH